MKSVQPQTSLNELNIECSYVARMATIEQSDIGVIKLNIIRFNTTLTSCS